MMGTFQLPAAEKPYRDSVCVCVCTWMHLRGMNDDVLCSHAGTHTFKQAHMEAEEEAGWGDCCEIYLGIYFLY